MRVSLYNCALSTIVSPTVLCQLSRLQLCFVNFCVSLPLVMCCSYRGGEDCSSPLSIIYVAVQLARIITMTLTSLVDETAFLSVENIIVFIIGFRLTGGYQCLQGTCCLHLSVNVEQYVPLQHCNHKTIWCHNPQCDCSAMKTANLILDYSTCFFPFL